jgi:hypothetical protein
MEIIFNYNAPKKILWKVLMDIADFAKKEGRFEDSKYLF